MKVWEGAVRTSIATLAINSKALFEGYQNAPDWELGVFRTPECTYCISASMYDAHGVGFHLRPSEVASAVHFQNNTIVPVAVIEVDQEYKDLFYRLSEISGYPGWPTELQTWRRWLNEKFGRPANRDIAVLARAIEKLANATLSSAPSANLERVVFSVSRFSPQFNLDLRSALQFAGLPLFYYKGYYLNQVVDSDAILAANEQGLCRDYRNDLAFKNRGSSPLVEGPYRIGSTDERTFRGNGSLSSNFWVSQESLNRIIEQVRKFDARSGAIAVDEYWTEVRRASTSIPLDRNQGPASVEVPKDIASSPKLLVILDEILRVTISATEAIIRPDLQNTTSDHITHLGSIKSLALILCTAEPPNSSFAAAMGAATYARRRSLKPPCCREPEYCDVFRAIERSGDVPRRQNIEMMYKMTYNRDLLLSENQKLNLANHKDEL